VRGLFGAEVPPGYRPKTGHARAIASIRFAELGDKLRRLSHLIITTVLDHIAHAALEAHSLPLSAPRAAAANESSSPVATFVPV
jgi:hypothetical protein